MAYLPWSQVPMFSSRTHGLQSSVWETSVAPWRHHLRRCGSCSRDVGEFLEDLKHPLFWEFQFTQFDLKAMAGREEIVWWRSLTKKLHSEKLFCVFSFLDRLANMASSVTDNQEGPTDHDETSEYTPPEAGGFKCDLSCLEVQIDVFALEWAQCSWNLSPKLKVQSRDLLSHQRLPTVGIVKMKPKVTEFANATIILIISHHTWLSWPCFFPHVCPFSCHVYLPLFVRSFWRDTASSSGSS